MSLHLVFYFHFELLSCSPSQAYVYVTVSQSPARSRHKIMPFRVVQVIGRRARSATYACTWSLNKIGVNLVRHLPATSSARFATGCVVHDYETRRVGGSVHDIQRPVALN